jgi:hypothetical protein
MSCRESGDTAVLPVLNSPLTNLVKNDKKIKLINPQSEFSVMIKGTVSRDFRPSVFSIKQSPLGP